MSPRPGSVCRALSVRTLVALVVLLAFTPATAMAADAEGGQDANLSVRITGLSPTVLSDGATVTLAGTVTNAGDQEWTSAQAYLVAPQIPFTTRQQITDAVASGASYTGERRVELDTIDELGTLEPGATTEFRVRVPYSSLNVTGAEGVYPVGVQILGTAEDGSRSGTAIGRATTFLPSVDRDTTTPTGVVVPFVMPDRRGSSGYADPATLADLTAPGSQLRNLLDLAEQVQDEGLTVVVDPSLLVALDDIAEGNRMPPDVELTEEQREDAATLRDDLVDLSRRVTCWILGYGRPDVLAIEQSGTEAITDAVTRATTTALNRFGLSGRRVTWPTSNGVTEDLVGAVREGGDQPVLLSRSTVPDWEPRLGSIVNRPGDDGPVPLLVNSGLDAGVPGGLTVATLRQRLLAEAALSTLEREYDATSRADAIAVVDPTWDPGTNPDDLGDGLDADFVEPVDLDELMNSPRSDYDGALPKTAEAAAVGAAQVEQVDDALSTTDSLINLIPEPGRVQDAQSARAADLVSIAWRKHPEEGLEAAREFARTSERTLGSITVDGPPAVTLSSSEGSFPITVTNGTDETVRIGLRLSSTNPRLDVPDVDPVEIAAGERRTLTVNASVGDQSSSTFTATMTSAEGAEFGEPAVFNVRSSRVGAAVWVAMGVAALFAAGALGRRFFTRRGRAAAGDADV
ncbi:DUF6049 family protein [Aeromicrobium sp. CTD01-1L150]|uniref:DUF6049 family protein n=1 Tax=Aeromicrobium sp. CTD01-1L150 TaxID=3341830 RepID=UPI0035C1BE3C